MNNFNFINVLILMVGILLIISGWKNVKIPDMAQSIIKGDFTFAASTGTANASMVDPLSPQTGSVLA